MKESLTFINHNDVCISVFFIVEASNKRSSIESDDRELRANFDENNPNALWRTPLEKINMHEGATEPRPMTRMAVHPTDHRVELSNGIKRNAAK